MRESRARASGWSTTVSCTGDTVAARRFATNSRHQDCGDDDLGTVRAVGVPGAAGISFDPEAVVHLGVMPFAQQAGILQRGRAFVGVPLEDMVDVTPVVRG